MLELSAKLRQVRGRANKRIRNQGLIPAILYGRKVKNIPLVIKGSDFEKIYQEAGESTLIKLNVSDGDRKLKKEERVVLIHDIARDPVSDKIIHIDFYQVKMDEAISTEVSLVFIGESEAVKRDGGVLVKNIQEIEVEALPADLPHEIEVDISVLKSFDDAIRIKDLKIPDKVKVVANADDMVASVLPPRTEEELAELEEKVVEEVEEVKVEEKGKAKEEVKEEATGAEKETKEATETDGKKEEKKEKE
jgi:large subunit ribosomal protein L25